MNIEEGGGRWKSSAIVIEIVNIQKKINELRIKTKIDNQKTEKWMILMYFELLSSFANLSSKFSEGA